MDYSTLYQVIGNAHSYEKIRQFVVRVASDMCVPLCYQDSEDITSEAVKAALEKAASIAVHATHSGKSFEDAIVGFLRTVARRRVTDRARARKQSPLLVHVEMSTDNADDPLQQLVAKEENDKLHCALSRLKEENKRQFLAIYYRHIQGKLFREIADILNITPQSAEELTTRAINILHKYMTQDS